MRKPSLGEVAALTSGGALAFIMAFVVVNAGSPETTVKPAAPKAHIEPAVFWTHVSQELADVLSESATPQATTRHWEDCYMNNADMRRATKVLCPEGTDGPSLRFTLP